MLIFLYESSANIYDGHLVSQRIIHHQGAAGIKQLLKGRGNSINPDIPIVEQTELLPYDKRWEFPRSRLKLGNLIDFSI